MFTAAMKKSMDHFSMRETQITLKKKKEKKKKKKKTKEELFNSKDNDA